MLQIVQIPKTYPCLARQRAMRLDAVIKIKLPHSDFIGLILSFELELPHLFISVITYSTILSITWMLEREDGKYAFTKRITAFKLQL